MENYLLNQVKNMEGSLLGIGITSEKLKKAIQNNNKITICNLLEENTKGIGKKKFSILNKPRTINIKKIKKIFKKKRVDNIICNIDTIKKFQKTFIRDSVYINKNKLYIYGNKEDLENIKEKYERYTNEIELKQEDKKYILIVNNTNTKNNKLKDILYWWKDTGNSFLDFLTLILTN